MSVYRFKLYKKKPRKDKTMYLRRLQQKNVYGINLLNVIIRQLYTIFHKM